ncbi:MAG TPA: hypothetical protein VNZ22_22615 [Bacillota bacterium]|nr:hypothetical protein [Bacillota bacterium]
MNLALEQNRISEDGVRSLHALGASAARCGDWAHSSSGLTLALEKSKGQPLCEEATDSSLGGLGDWTCWWPEERLTALGNKSRAAGTGNDGFFALILYLLGGTKGGGSPLGARPPTQQSRVLKTALRLRPRRALSSVSGQNHHFEPNAKNEKKIKNT